MSKFHGVLLAVYSPLNSSLRWCISSRPTLYLPGGMPSPSLPVTRNVELFGSKTAKYESYLSGDSGSDGTNTIRIDAPAGIVNGSPPLTMRPLILSMFEPQPADSMPSSRQVTAKR